jgi:hypothetical protein
MTYKAGAEAPFGHPLVITRIFASFSDLAAMVESMCLCSVEDSIQTRRAYITRPRPAFDACNVAGELRATR